MFKIPNFDEENHLTLDKSKIFIFETESILRNKIGFEVMRQSIKALSFSHRKSDSRGFAGNGFVMSIGSKCINLLS